MPVLSPRRVFRRARPSLERLLRALIRHRPTRSVLNAIYARLGRRAIELVYVRTAKIFRDVGGGSGVGTWTVRFAGRAVRLPLRGDRMWLDWDEAVSILGHEPDIKRCYASLLEGAWRPELFVDVGANYGTHSLLFLVAGVPALTFEPNDSCHEYFREACAASGVTPDLQPVALGAVPGQLALYFPPGETWLGSTEPEVIERLRREGSVPLERRDVEVRCLDQYGDRFAGKRALVKIDAEGHEQAILQGAERVLRDHRPLVIFEALPGSDRQSVAKLFTDAGYEIGFLPASGVWAAASVSEYVGATVSDFLAVPRELAR
ncbi:MAG: FkbM family methyltransferase [Gemmatimonadaceae bacterium]